MEYNFVYNVKENAFAEDEFSGGVSHRRLTNIKLQL